jgi:hypothetical protein
MKLDPHFVEVLKNFATINSGMIFKPGNVLRTMSGTKTILAQAEVDVTFEKEFGVYDLNRMLALLSMNKGGNEIELEDHNLVFLGLGGKGKIRQRLTDINLLQAPIDPTSSKNFSVANYDVSFKLNQEVFTWIFNVSSILKCPHTAIKGEVGKPMTLHAIDVKGEIVDSAFVTLDEIAQKRFNVTLKNDNIRVVSGEYDVEVSKSGFALFTNKAKKIKYWIALENKSTSFEE